ncbi:hypothetical protein B4U79_17183 [Dinothrombium tinctorium]|uniref:N-acetyltransferase domain-containing protein n=1 Tax=Dinothrombium tinctorium TaxID=1965070 RepID=A0A3S3PVA7_9ACAR|nr:hypothetical protein B4U79_17183 [Dinothrombium tinctorium]
MDSNKFQFRLLTNDDVKEASKLLTNAFCERDALVSCLVQNIGYIFNPENTISKGAQQELSIVCEDISQAIGERIVGIMLSSRLEFNENIAKHDALVFTINYLDMEWLRLHPEFKLDELREKVFHMEYLAVKVGYENLGIASRLVEESLNRAKQGGFQIVLVEATGYKSQRIFDEKLKFKQMNSIVYEEFEFKGKKIFKGLNGPPKFIAFEKNLQMLDSI